MTTRSQCLGLEPGSITFIQCGERCGHVFGPGSSERGFGSLFWERVCAKCGTSAMEADIRSDQP